MNYRRFFKRLGTIAVGIALLLIISLSVYYRYSYTYEAPSCWVSFGVLCLALLGVGLINLMTYGLGD